MFDLIITLGDADPLTLDSMLAKLFRRTSDYPDIHAKRIGYTRGSASYEGTPEHTASEMYLGLTLPQVDTLRAIALDVAAQHNQFAIGFWCVPKDSALVLTGGN